MTNYDLVICDWDESILDEVAEFVFKNQIGIYRNADDTPDIKRYLSNIQKRYPAEAVFIVKNEELICGWLALDRESESVAQLGRWQPVVKKCKSEEEIAGLILQGILDYSSSSGITRIESVFNDVTKENMDDYLRSEKWFSSKGFHKLEDNAYMTMQIQTSDLESRTIADNLRMERIDVIDENELYRCYYDSFVTGEDRDFLDTDEKQRRELFDQSIHSKFLNGEFSSVLKDGEKIIGFAIVHSREDEEHIDRFGIREEYRGKGLAKSYLINVIELVKTSDTSIVSIGVDTSNANALNLYRNIGFEINSRTIIHVWKSK